MAVAPVLAVQPEIKGVLNRTLGRASIPDIRIPRRRWTRISLNPVLRHRLPHDKKPDLVVGLLPHLSGRNVAGKEFRH